MSDKPKIFVAMPFREELDNVFYAIKQICNRKGYDVKRVDEGSLSEIIFAEIIESIVSSNVIIADVTQNNPNVFLEIGYSWAIGKEVLLIADQLDKLPFDIRGHRIIAYGDPSNASKIEKALIEPIESAVQKSQQSAHLTRPILEIARSVTNLEQREHLYYKLVESHLNRVKDQVERWLKGSLEVDKYELIEKGLEVFDIIQSGGFATYLVPIEGYWSKNDKYVEKSREVASNTRRNLTIERVYILHSFTSLLSEFLISNIKGDEKANIKTHVVFGEDINRSAMKDFGIWDDSVVCMIDVQESDKHELEVAGGVYSKDGADLRLYRSYKDEIMSHAIRGTELIKEVESFSANTRLLLESVFIMEALAAAHCEGSYLSIDCCDWYHSSWQYLRLVDMVSTPAWHQDFYQKALTYALSGKKQSRVLISGTADYGMLQQIQSLSAVPSIAEVTVLDLCKTPLEICTWFYEHFLPSTINFNCLRQSVVGNMLAAKSQDLIISDAFLTRFAPDERKTIIEEWRRMLKDDGVIITTIRLNDNSPSSTAVISTAVDVKRYSQKAKNNINKSGRLLKNIEGKIIEKAMMYAEKIISYPFMDEQEIKGLFEGFDLNIELGEVSGELQGNTVYARVVAKKSKC
jgi:hypothetical protein